MVNSLKKNVLVVEDNIESQLIFEIYLRDDYNVDTVGRGLDGLKSVQSKNFDLVVLDINLPGEIDGLRFITEVREKLKLVKLPILVVTAYALKGDRETSLGKGANDYMTKPINKELFLSKIKNLI